ncbi:MAG TPA: transposase [Candidatus Acidoferrum sp.]
MSAETALGRRSIRIAGADYTEAGGYFVTICAANRGEIFGKIKDGRIRLSRLGELVRTCWVQIPEHFANVEIKEFVVMPNHLHGIIGLNARSVDGLRLTARGTVAGNARPKNAERFQKPVEGSIPTIVRAFKAAVTRRAKQELKIAEPRIWQSNYFERVLRDGREYAIASRYVMENVMRWEWDEENARRMKS